MDTANVRWPDSLWAAVTPPGPQLPELEGDAQADVIVIGGGFTGLSTALHLREAGVDVTVVEAMEPGWGASGRNNGQVIPTLSRPDPEDIIARHGAVGERFVALLRDSVSTLFDLAPAGITQMQPLLESDDPISWVDKLSKQNLPRVSLSEIQWCAPVERQEVWAAGVTYLRSKTARMEESDFSATAYDKVYAAERPEIFFKSLAKKVVATM